MGQYLIPGVGLNELSQAIDHLRLQGAWSEDQVWDHGVEGGTLFSDPSRTDEGCASLYLGFTVDPGWRPELHEAIRTHAGHLLAFEAAVRDGTQAAKTQAQRASEMEHVLADVIAYIRLTEDRL